MASQILKTGPWRLSDLSPAAHGAPTVFSCFSCGGGSTMGYKLAGFDFLGGVEIDPEMTAVYRKNHRPRFSYLEGIQEFKARLDLPRELFALDVLDGSPPCSSFSMSGNREKDWGKKKVFREGQSDQVLDDLFFHFIDTVRILRPKAVVAENVKGLIVGNARGYVKQIFDAFRSAGYDCQLFLLNASRMGVPQRRERTFFFARRSDLGLPPIRMSFGEREISCRQAFAGINPVGTAATELQRHWWSRIKPGQSFSKGHPKGHWFNCFRLHPDLPFSSWRDVIPR
jgi:DNA (cytosine-5)-methyltransferase 1